MKIFLTILISFVFALSAVSVSAQTVREQFMRQREEAAEMIQQKRSELKSAIEAKRAELREAIQAKRQELKAQLQKVRDERKKQIVERVDARMDALNQRLTDHYISVLEQIEGVLGRVVSRTDKAAANGANVTAVRVAITKAQAAIVAGRTAVTNQAGKTYNITISSEGALRGDVGIARQTLHDDLAVARDAVRAAHTAARGAAVSLAQIPRVNDLDVPGSGQSATSSPATTTQSQ